MRGLTADGDHTVSWVVQFDEEFIVDIFLVDFVRKGVKIDFENII